MNDAIVLVCLIVIRLPHRRGSASPSCYRWPSFPAAASRRLRPAVITLTEEDGETSSARTDSVGFYSVRAATGPVVVTASKDGYKTRQSRFDVTESTVLNFALRPTD